MPDDLLSQQECIITRVTPCDSASGKGYGSFSISADANHLTKAIAWYDSSTQSVNYQAAFSYANDTMSVSKNIFFLLDGAGRIREFHTPENPLDTASAQHIFLYTYDAEGQLQTKTWLLNHLGNNQPLFSYRYKWSNGNLVGVEVTEAQGDKRKALSAELEYDQLKTVKNFLYFLPEAHELAPYIFSVNVGRKPKHLLEKITVVVFDTDGSPVQTYHTAYTHYQFSANGNVTSFFASGDVIDGLPQVEGLTKFEYSCK